MKEEGRGFRRTWIDHTVDVEASTGEVYDLLADIDGWPSWTPGLTAIKRKGKGRPAVGQRFTMYFKPAPFHPPLPVPCELYELSPQRIVWGGGIPGSLVRHSFEISELGANRSRVRQLEFATNLIAVLTLIAEPGIYKHDLRMQNALRDKFARK
jgi:Polyketide cyclase / dehydrase and lipid transport